MPQRASLCLTDVSEGTFIVDSLSDRDAPTLRSLKASGLTPGAKLRVTRSPANNYSVRVGRSTTALDLPADVAREVRILPVSK